MSSNRGEISTMLNLRLRHLKKVCDVVAGNEKQGWNESEAFFYAGDAFMLGLDCEEGFCKQMAKLCYRITAELDPKHAGPLVYLANIIADEGDNEAAIALYQQCFRLNCNQLSLGIVEENPYYNIGICYQVLGRLKEAEAYYLAGIAMGEIEDWIYARLCPMLHSAEEYDRAAKYYKQWLSFEKSTEEAAPCSRLEVIGAALALAEAKQPLASELLRMDGRLSFLPKT